MNILRYSCLFLLFHLIACQSAEPESSPPPKKAIFIILDGIPADVLERVETPMLDEIAGEHGYTRAYVGGDTGTYNETPTISAPGYMDLLTATWANKHNVWGNYEQTPNYNYWNVFRIAEAATKDSLRTAIFSTWLDNRTVLVGDGQNGLSIDYAFDGFEQDTVRFPHDEERTYIREIDKLVSFEAVRYIREEGPDLSWIYLEYTDDVGHASGDSEELDQAIRLADAEVGKVWRAVQEREAQGEDWMVVVTTDHGRDATSGRDHGGQSLRERTTWIVTNADELNRRFTEGEPPVIDISPSILDHLGIQPPEPVSNEMDGISFLGPVSLDHFQAHFENKTLKASWEAVSIGGEAKILLSFSNDFPQGRSDHYREVAQVPVADGEFALALSDEQWTAYEKSGFLKVLIKAPHNRANYWISSK